LQPDLIIGNKEENYIEGIDELKKHFPVWMSDIYDLDDSCQMITSVGDITGTEEAAQKLVTEIRSSFDRLASAPILMPPLSCAYFIWRKPYMVAAPGTFIDNMISLLGVQNVFADMTRYPEVSAELIAERKPDLIFLSSEPYSFTDRHKAEFQNISPEARIIIVNGELFSWYGSHLRYTAAYFEQLRASLSSVD
jgi:ABC-type Fe3+-hydroxamate transport system substrate-binding protein